MTTDQGKEVIISGWKEAGVSDAFETVLSKFPSLYPFNDILPNEERIDFEIHKMYPRCKNPFVYYRQDEDD